MGNYFWGWTLSWSVDDVSSDILLNKTDFPFPSRHPLQIPFDLDRDETLCLLLLLHVEFFFFDWTSSGLLKFEKALWVHMYTSHLDDILLIWLFSTIKRSLEHKFPKSMLPNIVKVPSSIAYFCFQIVSFKNKILAS